MSNKIKFLTGDEINLPVTKVPGQVYFTSDGNIYFDQSSSNRILMESTETHTFKSTMNISTNWSDVAVWKDKDNSTSGTVTLDSELLKPLLINNDYGTYLIQIYLQNARMMYSGLFSWDATIEPTTYSSDAFENEILLQRFCHSSEDLILYLRTSTTYAGSYYELKFQACASKELSGDIITIKVRRLI